MSENAWHKYHHSLFENSTSAIAMLNEEGNVVEVNGKFEEIFKFDQEEIEGKNLDDVLESGRPGSVDREMTDRVLNGSKVVCEGTRFDRHGNPREFLIKGVPITDNMENGKQEKVTGIYAIFDDITERKRKEEKLEYLCYHDSLTGLYNRRFLEEKLQELNREPDTVPVSVILADINGLQIVNESYGMKTGDRLLQRTAVILQDAAREKDVVGRWSGDGFIVLMKGAGKQEAEKIYNNIISDRRMEEKVEGKVKLSLGLGMAVSGGGKSKEQDLYGAFHRARSNLRRNKMTIMESEKSNLLQGILRSLGSKSYETEEHARRLARMSERLGQAAGLSSHDINDLKMLGSLHDIGKVTISEEILSKPGELTSGEWEKIKQHPERGQQIAVATEDFAHLATSILTHHERWDGTGYPLGLEGDEIPVMARIISIVDAFDVMIKGRPYKEPVSRDNALREIKRCAGTQFDPQLADRFVKIMG